MATKTQRPQSYNPRQGGHPTSTPPKDSASKPRPLSVNPGALQNSPLYIETANARSSNVSAAVIASVDTVYRKQDFSSDQDADGDFSFNMSRTAGSDDPPTPVPGSANSTTRNQKTVGKQKTIVMESSSSKQRTVVVTNNKQKTVVVTNNKQKTVVVPPPVKKRRGFFARWFFPHRHRAQHLHQYRDVQEEEDEFVEFDFESVRKEAAEREEIARVAAAAEQQQQKPAQRVFGSARATLTGKRKSTVEAVGPTPASFGKVVISGTLLKRAKKTGQWNSRRFTLYDSLNLTWLKSDNKTVLSILLAPKDQVQVRDVKFGVRKFMFEITVGTQETLLLSAAGETEKEEWMRTLNSLLAPAATQQQRPAEKRKSLAMVQKGMVNEVQKLNAEAIILGITNRGQMPTSLKSQQANERLKAKLGNVTAATQGFMCANCDLQVFQPEAVRLRDYVILHRHCFTCFTCDKLLTVETCEQHSDGIFCPKHFAEHFPGALSTRKPHVAVPVNPRAPLKDKKRAMENRFQLVFTNPQTGKLGETVWMAASSRFERDRWVLVLCNAIALLELKRVVFEAQKVDMMTAIECQMELEAFITRSDVEYSAFMEKLKPGSQTKWERSWFQLTREGKLQLSKTDKSTKPRRIFQLAHNTLLLDSQSCKLNGPLNLT